MNGAIKEKSMEIITLPQAEADKWIKNWLSPFSKNIVPGMDKQGLKGAGNPR